MELTVNGSLLPLEDYFSGNTDVKIFDLIHDPQIFWRHEHCMSHQVFSSFLQSTDQISNVQTRIVSFHCPSVDSRLEACREDLKTLFETYGIHPCLSELVEALGVQPDSHNAGNYPTVLNQAGTESFECWYQLKHAEKNDRSKTESWSLRQTGVYHKYDMEKNFNLLLLFHPSKYSAFEETLLQFSGISPREGIASQILRDAWCIHVFLVETCSRNWNEHIRVHVSAFNKLKYSVHHIESLAPPNTIDLELIRSLHRHQEVSSTASLFCQGNNNVFRKICEILPIESIPQKQWLCIRANRALDHFAVYENLIQQAKNAMSHLQYVANHQNQTLAIKDQAAAAELNRTLLELTYTTADDSAAIKVITILGLVFLPGGFIAALFGMDFFNFQSNKLTMGKNLWIFLAFWIPVTATTVLIYIAFIFRR